MVQDKYQGIDIPRSPLVHTIGSDWTATWVHIDRIAGVDPFNSVLDLNGNGQVCVASGVDDGDPSDREVFRRVGLFFNENWGSCSSRRTKFYFSHRICKNNACATGNVDFSLANSGDHAINSGKAMPEGESPWPNSFHPGGVSVGFADGRAQFLNESIDGKVFYNLMKPQSGRLMVTPLLKPGPRLFRFRR